MTFTAVFRLEEIQMGEKKFIVAHKNSDLEQDNE
jgi:hypothetical protein